MDSLAVKKVQSLLKEIKEREAKQHPAFLKHHFNNYFHTCDLARAAAKLGAEALIPIKQGFDSFTYQQRLFSLLLMKHSPDQEALSILATQAKDPDDWIRFHAAMALTSLKGNEVRTLLEVLSQDEDSGVRKEALSGLQNLGSEQSLEVIIPGLEDDDAQVRREAVKAIIAIPGGRTTDILLDMLADPQMGVAFEAKRGLQKRLKERDFLPDLVDALGRKGRYTRTYAIELLDKNKDPRMNQPLMDYLEICDNKALREQIVTVLGKTKKPEVLPALWASLSDFDRNVIEAAIKGLKKIPDPRSLPYLREYTERIKQPGSYSITPHDIEKRLIEVVLASKSDELEGFLHELLLHPDRGFVIEAIKALQKKKLEIPIAMLVQRLESEEYKRDFNELKSEITALLEDKQDIDIISTIDFKDAEYDQTEELESTSTEREETPELETEEFDQLSNEEALIYIGKIIKKTYFSTSMITNRLVNIGGAQAVLLLRRMLKHPAIEARGAAVYALERLGYADFSDEDKAVKIILSARAEHEKLRDLGQAGINVLELLMTRAHRAIVSVELLTIFWESEHPKRVDAAIEFISGWDGDRTDKAAIRFLKGAKQEAEDKMLTAFLTSNGPYQIGDKMEAARMLGHYKTKAAVEPLLECFKPDYPAMHAPCAEALGKIKDQRAIEPLVDALNWVEEGPALTQVMGALEKLKAKQAIPILKSKVIKRPKLHEKREKVLQKLQSL